MQEKKLPSRGYTLLEVMVIVLIFGILSSVGLPNFMSWLHSYRLQSAVVSLVNHLRSTKLLAILKGTPHQIQLRDVTDGNYYQVVEDPDGQDRIVMSIGRIILDKEFGEVIIKSVSSTSTSQEITFKPRGTSNNATIVLENSVKQQVKIIISNGRVRSEN